MSRHGRAGRSLAAFVGVVVAPLASAGTAAAAGQTVSDAQFTGGSFHADATADAFRLTVFDPNAILRQDHQAADGGGPSAYSLLDSVGESNAYASFPFPGVDVATLPGLGRSLLSAPVPPDYPLFVASSDPAIAEQRFDGGPITMEAHSTSAGSGSSVSVGGDAQGSMVGLAQSTTAVGTTAKEVTSVAASRITGLSLGPLQLGEVLSHATMLLRSDGTTTKQADTVVTGARVGDTPVELTSQGLALGPNAPQGTDLSSLNSALAAAGITVELIPEQVNSSGVAAPAVRITRLDPTQKDSRIFIMLGAASVTIDSAATQSAVAPMSETPAGSAGRLPAFDTVAPVGLVPANEALRVKGAKV